MSSSVAVHHPTLISALWPVGGRSGLLRPALIAVAGSLLLIVSAKIQVPFWPVPMTLQTLAVLLIGITFGARLGTAAVILYLLEGALGLPVFAGSPARGIGIAYMIGPTGGYLLGFLAATLVLGYFARRGWDRGIATALLAMLTAEAVIFLFGVGWLAALMGFETAVAAGLLPFLPGEALKLALAAALLPFSWRLLGRRATGSAKRS